MLFGERTWPEIRTLAEIGAVAIVPFGCTEQQGTHLPVDFDSWFAAELTRAAAAENDRHGQPTLVLPVIPVGRPRNTETSGPATSTSRSTSTTPWPAG